MWTYDAHFNITDFTSTTVVVFADAGEAYVQVWVLGSKPGAPTAPVLYTTLHAPAYGVATTPISSANPAFAGGYGAIHLVSVAGPSSPVNLFGAQIVESNPAADSAVGGAAFFGTDFVCPVTAAPPRTTSAIHVVTTLLSTASQSWDITVSQAGGAGFSATQTVAPGMTWRWASDVAGVNVDAAQTVKIHCNSYCVASLWKINAGVATRVYLPSAIVG